MALFYFLSIVTNNSCAGRNIYYLENKMKFSGMSQTQFRNAKPAMYYSSSAELAVGFEVKQEKVSKEVR